MKSQLSALTVTQLVNLFERLSVEQDQALLYSDTAKYNRLFKQMEMVEAELKRRTPDQRRALESLFQHDNPQVRLQAAKATLAVVPIAARNLLESIAQSGKHPQAGDAAMSIVNLDRGIFKPS